MNVPPLKLNHNKQALLNFNQETITFFMGVNSHYSNINMDAFKLREFCLNNNTLNVLSAHFSITM